MSVNHNKDPHNSQAGPEPAGAAALASKDLRSMERLFGLEALICCRMEDCGDSCCFQPAALRQGLFAAFVSNDGFLDRHHLVNEGNAFRADYPVRKSSCLNQYQCEEAAAGT